MDITYFFEEAEINEEYKDINLLLHKAIENNKLELLEYTYIMDFLGQNGNIININWLKKILNKIDDKELTNIFNDKFKKYLVNDQMKELIEYKKEVIEFTDDQKGGICKIFNFMMDPDQKTYGLYGYAGTGKTTTIVEIMSFLLEQKYIKSIAFTAPTNKAVNVMKSKFKLYLEDINKKIIKKETNGQTIDELTLELSENKIKIDFITIHKLLKLRGGGN
jgi:tRNA(Met) C34 N-acetyltransferase TmcA